MENREKVATGLRGFEFWKHTLKGAQLVVAPMVDASELAWRMLSRRYGAELCYTPMLHATVFVKNARYRKENLVTCPEDKPLIVQFCANDPETFSKAAQLAAPYCDAIDLNLGCPQAIAKKGRYGSFLMEEWTLISDMIKKASSEIDIPITAKIRIFPDVAETIRYAQMLEDAGVSLLTVHGRTRNQKGALTGVADWEFIKLVREAVKIPVFANGNIQYLPDVERCLKVTGVQGVMSAEGNLHNPAIFKGQSPVVWDIVFEYLDFVEKYPCPLSYIRGHVFKIVHHCFTMPENFEIRFQMSKASSLATVREVTTALKNKMMDYFEGRKPWIPPPGSEHAKLPLPPWLCQPYVRIPAEEHLKKLAEGEKKALEKVELEKQNGVKRFHPDGTPILSNKKLKRMKRNPKKNYDQPPPDRSHCLLCRNPKGIRCAFSLCRSCCKLKCQQEDLECHSHRRKGKSKGHHVSTALSFPISSNDKGDTSIVSGLECHNQDDGRAQNQCIKSDSYQENEKVVLNNSVDNLNKIYLNQIKNNSFETNSKNCIPSRSELFPNNLKLDSENFPIENLPLEQ